MNGFRITINMHHFVHDHRTPCRLYVSDELKTIQDLHSHISKLFNITDDFYLISSNNVYIPDTEDVRILTEGEVVSVIPCPPTELDKQTKKKYRKYLNGETVEELGLNVSAPSKPSRKKLKTDVYSDLHEHKQSKEKKKKKSKNDKIDCFLPDQDVAKKEEKKKPKATYKMDVNDKANLSFNNNIKELYRNQKNINVTPMPISTKPNIVPIITVSTSWPQANVPFPLLNGKDNVNHQNFLKARRSSIENIIVDTKPDQLNNVHVIHDQVLITPKKASNQEEDDMQKKDIENDTIVEQNNCITSTPNENDLITDVSMPSPSLSLSSKTLEESTVDSLDMTVTQRKRKRCRKRKAPANNYVKTPAVALIYNNVPPFSTHPKPTTHIRFDRKEETCNGTGLESGAPTNGVIPEEPQIANKLEATRPLNVIDLVCDMKGCERELLKYPIMKDKLPKAGDIIAFKMFVLSNAYTPEISNLIIAKVVKYDSVTSFVTISCLEGGDQCDMPNGKFSLEEEKDNGNGQEKSYHWQQFIEPRLLFP